MKVIYYAWAIGIFLFGSCNLYAQKLTIGKAVNTALSEHPEILSAREDLSALSAKRWSDISPPNPVVFYEAEGIPLDTYSLNGYQERKYGISQSFDFPLSIFYRAKQSRQAVYAARQRLDRVKQKIRRDVKIACFSYISAKQKQLLHQSIYELTLEQLDKARVRVLAGESTAYDSLRARVDLAEAQNQLAASKREIHLTKQHLLLQIGKETTEDFDIDFILDYTPEIFNADELADTALKYHPEIVEKQETRKRLLMQSRSAWADILPGISITYFQKEHKASNQRGWGAEIGLSLPLWFFLENQGNIRQASFRVSSADYELAALKLKIEHNIRQAVISCQNAQTRVINFQEGAVKEAEELVRIASMSYQEGEMSYLEWTEAVRAMDRVQIGLLDAMIELHKSKADLEYAAGQELFPAYE